MNELYQIGIPIERMSTFAMLYDCYEMPCKYLVTPSTKTKGWVVIELRDTVLASEVIKAIPDSKVKIVDIPVKVVQL